MKILESKFVQGFIKMANDGYLQGWHERNGGNLSYRLKPEEVEMIRPRLNTPGEWTPIGVEVPGLAGEFFLVTGSGNISEILSWIPKYVLRSLNWMRQEQITESVGAWLRAADLPVSFLLI